MALISIVVPIYNTEVYLEKCVCSLINQTYEDIEIILVDDGSPDNCPKMCDEFAKKDSRIKVIHKKNGGLSSARNAALEICSGEWVGFVDSDDYIEPTMFEKLYNSVTENNSQIAICAHYTVNETDKTLIHRLPFEKISYEKDEIFENFIIPLIGKDLNAKIPKIEGFVWRQLFSKDIIENIRFKSEKEFFAEDVVFDLEVYPRCKKISVVNEPLYYYVFNSDSLSNKYRNELWKKFKRLIEYKKSVVDQFDSFELCKKRYYNEICRLAKISIINLGKKECSLTNKEKCKELSEIRDDLKAMSVFELSIFKYQDIKTKTMLLLLRLGFFKQLLTVLNLYLQNYDYSAPEVLS